jgi:hypothetical protein
MMRRAAIVLSLLSISAPLVVASEIREFSVPTLERLGNELIRASQRPDRGATDPVRKRARQTVIAALKGKLVDARYDYVVLNDPDGSGFLVYALALADPKRVIQTGGFCRVTVSADGGTVERIDLPSAFIRQELPRGTLKIITSTQHSSNLPAETWLYTSHIYGVPVYLATKDKSFWTIESGKIHKLTKAEMDATESKPKKK